jgi:hypothetical protein
MNDAYDTYIGREAPKSSERFCRCATSNSTALGAEDGAMKSVGRIHQTRLAASKVHRRFVQEARRALQKLGWQVPEDGISPTQVGAMPLPFPVPDSFEIAFGYRGNLHFAQLGYTAGSRQFGYSDGGDDLPSDASLWSWFLHHRVVAPHLPERQTPTLYGKFPSGN